MAAGAEDPLARVRLPLAVCLRDNVRKQSDSCFPNKPVLTTQCKH